MFWSDQCERERSFPCSLGWCSVDGIYYQSQRLLNQAEDENGWVVRICTGQAGEVTGSSVGAATGKMNSKDGVCLARKWKTPGFEAQR